jgi:hypothetical protein
MQDNRVDAENLLSSLGKFKGPAPVHLWNPPYCGEIDIRIAADGRWYHNGNLIRRPALMQLFASVLRREEDGSYSLVTPAERVGIQVDDCPFVATLLDIEGQGNEQRLMFTLNTAETVIADASHPLRFDSVDGDPHPVLAVRDGLEALVSRNVYYQLVDCAQIEVVGDQEHLVLLSAGARFDLGAAQG